MSTTYYFTNLSGTPPVAFSNVWSSTSSAPRLLFTAYQNSDPVKSRNISITDVGASFPTYLGAQFISEYIGDTSISGKVSGQMLFGEALSRTNAFPVLKLWIARKSGAEVTGIKQALLLDWTGTNEISASGNVNRYLSLSGATLIPYTMSVGSGIYNYIVAELGVSTTNIVSATNATFLCGSHTGTILPRDETSTSAYAPWLSFSQNIIA